MANIPGQYAGSLVMIFDSNNNFISQTIVAEHNKRDMYIVVKAGLENIKTGSRLNLLIIHSQGASEFGGILKIARKGSNEISLFGEHQRGARAAMRHTLNVPALIRVIIVDTKQEMLYEAQQVIIENISTTGIMVKSPLMLFPIGAILRVESNINGKDAILYGQIIREQLNSDNTYSYGCKLIFPH